MNKKRLERDQEKAIISGVLVGLANYFDQDPTLFRIVAIIFLILTGIFPGLLVYLAVWIIMPKKDKSKFDYEIVE